MMNTKSTIFAMLFAVLSTSLTLAQASVEQELIEISKNKWQWMADKDVEKLSKLFHKDAQYVHMGGSWGTEREL